MELHKCIKILFTISIYSLLYSCATVIDGSVENLSGPIPDSNGIVIAETMNNSVRITGRLNEWDEIILWQVNEGSKNKTYSINAVSGPVGSKLYFGAIPKGRYKIGLLVSTSNLGYATETARVYVPPNIGSFKVEAGAVTNLGKLIYQPLETKNWVEKELPDYVITRVASENLWNKMAALKSSAYQKVGENVKIIGWEEDDFDDERKAAAELISASALPVNAIAGKHSASAFLVGKAGGFYIKVNEAADWLRINTNTFNEIKALNELPTGEILLGGENGYFASFKPLSYAAEKLAPPNELAHILDIGTHGDFNYIVTLEEDVFNFYEFYPNKATFKKIKSLSHSQGTNNLDLAITKPKVVHTEKGITLYFDKYCYQFSVSTKQWAKQECTPFYSIVRQPDGTLAGAPYSNWSGIQSGIFSYDNGKSWTPQVKKKSLIVQGYKDKESYRASNGDLFRIGRDIQIKFLKLETREEVPLLKSTDGGETWQQIGGLPRQCVKLLGQISSDEKIHALCDNGKLVASIDLGENWEEVFSPPIFAPQSFPPSLYIKYKRK